MPLLVGGGWRIDGVGWKGFLRVRSATRKLAKSKERKKANNIFMITVIPPSLCPKPRGQL